MSKQTSRPSFKGVEGARDDGSANQGPSPESRRHEGGLERLQTNDARPI